MRAVMIGLWMVVSLAVVAHADEAAPAEEAPAEKTSEEKTSEEKTITAAEPQTVESPVSAEEKADAEIRQIEEGVSDTKDVKEFKPTRPLSADKAIALPSDI